MKVTLLAHTQLNEYVLKYRNLDSINFGPLEIELTTQDADDLAEFAGRACYQSWDKPNPKTATNQGYLKNIIEKQHFSVLEHASVSFYIEDVSIALTRELIRHRHFSFSEMSTRYVDMDDYSYAKSAYRPAHYNMPNRLVHTRYQSVIEDMEGDGYTGKSLRELARYVIPLGWETKIVVTGNHRAWREVIQKRNNPHAFAEFQELAKELLRQLKTIAPNTYQDMEP